MKLLFSIGVVIIAAAGYLWHRQVSKRTQIPYVLEVNQLSQDTVKAYGHHSGMNGNEATEYVRYDMFFVSTKKEVDSLGNVAEKLYPLNMIKH